MDGSVTLRWPARPVRIEFHRPVLYAASAAAILLAAVVGTFGLGRIAGRSDATAFTRQSLLTPANSPAQAIRVLLLDQVSQCDLQIDQPFDVVEWDRRTILMRGLPATTLTVRFERGGLTLVGLDHGFLRQTVDLVPAAPARIKLTLPKGPRYFAGSMRLHPRTASSGDVLNVVDMETYLLGVVPAEALKTFPEQAMRTQAIIARTFAWYTKITAGPSRDWDVVATEGSQMYIGLPAREGLAERAVRDTRGVICAWASPAGERIFCTYYSSTCGGCTQDAGPVKNECSIPPLGGGVHCDHCRASPFYRWNPVRFEKSTITQKLRDKYPVFRGMGRIESMEVVEATPDGRPVRFLLSDAQGRSAELEAENFRLTVDSSGRIVRSTCFVPVVEKNAIVLTSGRGFGHGMGLCQYGSAGLADAGWHAAQILRFYYPGCHLTRAY